MRCGVMRVEKRGRGAVYGLQIEANRTKSDYELGRDFVRSDIDWSRTGDNIHLAKTESWGKAITERIKADGLKERKDSIVLLDGLYTASAEFFDGKSKEEMLDYFKACLDFHAREFCGGDKSLILNAVIHLDEATPHMQVVSIPIIEDEKGKHLSAAKIMGNLGDYCKRQDRFFEQVTKGYGLERGDKRLDGEAQKKVHTTKREWQIAEQEEKLAKLGAEAKATVNRTNGELADAKDELDAVKAMLARKKADLDKLGKENAQLEAQIAPKRQKLDELERITLSLEKRRKRAENALQDRSLQEGEVVALMREYIEGIAYDTGAQGWDAFVEFYKKHTELERDY